MRTFYIFFVLNIPHLQEECDKLKKIVVLVGGVGGAKLAYGLAQIVPAGDLTIIVNTGDDFVLHGLQICPDMDTVMYTLGGIVDKNNGWGVAGDTTHMLEAMRRYGEDPWFGLGDQDLATHLLRTTWLHAGMSLTDVTSQLSQRLGITQHILPMTDQPVATKVLTKEHGQLDFQVYFVKHRWQPVVQSLKLEGAERAVMNPAVIKALSEADAILIGPSNPWLSVAPILAVPGLRDLLTSRAVPRVAVTPIIAGTAVKGPAAKLMAELGYAQSAKAVAEYYADVINGFVIDQRDADLSIIGLKTIAMNTLMNSEADRVTLAQMIMNWIGGWN